MLLQGRSINRTTQKMFYFFFNNQNKKDTRVACVCAGFPTTTGFLHLEELCKTTKIILTLERLPHHEQKQESVCFTYNNKSLQEFIFLLVLVVKMIFMKKVLVILFRQLRSGWSAMDLNSQKSYHWRKNA